MSISSKTGRKAIVPVRVVDDSDLVDGGGQYKLQGRIAVPAYGLDSVPSGQPVIPGPKMAIYLVTDAMINSGKFKLSPKTGPASYITDESLAVAQKDSSFVAIPVYLVGGTLNALVVVPSVPGPSDFIFLGIGGVMAGNLTDFFALGLGGV